MTWQRGNPAIRRAFDAMERVLREEASLAGVFSHSTTIGSAREFFVSRVLDAVLPRTMMTGHGQIIDTEGRMSPEIDVIVYDARFPAIRISNKSYVYLAEGVIAGIEVKSRLDATRLRDALQHCSQCAPVTLSVDPDDYRRAIERVKADSGVDDSQAKVFLENEIGPRFYIFSFQSDLSVESVAKIVLEHIVRRSLYTLNNCRLPRLIVAGEIVVWLADERTSYDIDDNVFSSISADSNVDIIPLFSCWQCPSQFGLMAYSLLRTAIERIGPDFKQHALRYKPESHLPAGLYLDEVADTHACHVFIHVNRHTREIVNYTMLRATGADSTPATDPARY